MSTNNDEIRILEIAKDLAIAAVNHKSFQAKTRKPEASSRVLDVFKEAVQVVRKEMKTT